MNKYNRSSNQSIIDVFVPEVSIQENFMTAAVGGPEKINSAFSLFAIKCFEKWARLKKTVPEDKSILL